MAHQWKDQVVLITGGASGIGAIVVRLIVEEGTKFVAILDVAEAAGIELQNELNSKYGAGKVKFYKCDVTDDDLLLGTFKTVKDEQGYIDVVINNAGIMCDRPHVYRKAIAVNVTALITGTLKAIEYMRKDKPGGRGGTVVNIASIAAIYQCPLLPIYFGTKSAVLQFSNCIGLDEYYSRTGVRVLAICFGATATPLVDHQNLGSFDPDFEKDVFKSIGENEFQTPDYAAAGVVAAFKEGKSGSTWLVDDKKPAVEITSDVKKAYEIMSSKMAPWQ